MRVVKWYKYDVFWRRGDADGNESPQDHDDGTDDIIWNTLTKIVIDQDTSLWAFNSFRKCLALLKERRRYPDEFLTGRETPNMLVYWWKHNVTKEDGVLKPQGRMSRDPFIALGTCYAFLMLNMANEYALDTMFVEFHSVTIPFHLRYDIGTMIWWKQLKVDYRGNVPKHLDHFKALAVVYTSERRKYLGNFYQDIP